MASSHRQGMRCAPRPCWPPAPTCFGLAIAARSSAKAAMGPLSGSCPKATAAVPAAPMPPQARMANKLNAPVVLLPPSPSSQLCEGPPANAARHRPVWQPVRRANDSNPCGPSTAVESSRVRHHRDKRDVPSDGVDSVPQGGRPSELYGAKTTTKPCALASCTT